MMRIFYFCDIKPSTNQLQCYSHQADSNQFGELPGYVDHIVGYSVSQGGMYFRDKSGGTLFTKDGERMIMLDSSTTLPDDLVASSSVPGKGKDMPTVSLEGGYDADFGGVTYNVIISNQTLLLSLNSLIFARGTKYSPGRPAAIHEEERNTFATLHSHFTSKTAQ